MPRCIKLFFAVWMLAWTSWGWADDATFLGVGGYAWDEVDSRKPAEWDDYPQVVRVEEVSILYGEEQVSGTCTGAFVAANVVATARHCFLWSYDEKGKCYDQSANNENIFLRVVLNDGSTMRANVKYCPGRNVAADWALLQTEKVWPHYYNFVPSDKLGVKDAKKEVKNKLGVPYYEYVPGHSDPIDITNLGFGSMKILEPSEIEKVRDLLQKFAKSQNNNTNNYKEVISFLQNTGLTNDHDKLKVSEKCEAMWLQQMFWTNCDGWTGNSGGPVLNYGTKNLFAVASAVNRDVSSGVGMTNLIAVAVRNPPGAKSLLDEARDAEENRKNNLIEKMQDFQSMSPLVEVPQLEPEQVAETDGINLMPVSYVNYDNWFEQTEHELKEKKEWLNNSWARIDELTDKEIVLLLDAIVGYNQLQERYEQALEKERSFGNRMLGSVAMGAGGIGTMMAATAIAEQNADAQAEQDMRQYLATFVCKYDDGVNVPGGTYDVELPGGNQLINLYGEYVNLANDVKTRKNALGLKPGIESESILDAASSGLYDNVGQDNIVGAYVSLSRALQNPDGEDAQKWAQQQEKSTQKMKTGGIVGLGGVGVGAVGNLMFNQDEESDEKD